jgi:hypothetical protein
MMRTVLATLSTATFLTILTACALLTQTPASPAHDPSLVACKSFRLMTWAPGDDQMAVDLLREVRDGKRDVASVAAARETLTQLRELVGDTSTTVIEIKGHNAAFRALCPNGAPASESPEPSAVFREPQTLANSDGRQ